MTDELLNRAKNAQEKIRSIENTLWNIQKIKILESEDVRSKTRYERFLRFVNVSKRKDGKETKEGRAFLFDGVSLHGTELLVDNALLDCLKEYYEKRLEEAKEAYDAL